MSLQQGISKAAESIFNFNGQYVRKFLKIYNPLRDFAITWGENQNVTEPPKVENEEVSHGFMDSLLYVMIPSLLSFFALFWAFYALHSYTVDTKVVSQLYQRMKESRNSIRQKFTNSGTGSNPAVNHSVNNIQFVPNMGRVVTNIEIGDNYKLIRKKLNQPVGQSQNHMKILTAQNKRISIHQLHLVTNMQFECLLTLQIKKQEINACNSIMAEFYQSMLHPRGPLFNV